MTNSDKTLVIGANGKTGRRVADRLSAAGRPVRRGSRTGSPAFDWDDASTWRAALAGVDQVYISYQPDLAVPEALPAIGQLTQLAVESGVRKLVLLSGRGEEGAEACEEVVQRCGLEWTIVRTSWFAQNFDEGHFLDAVLSGTFAMPPGSVPEPLIDVDDIADVAAAALLSDGHSGRLYELTGPRLITFPEAVEEIAVATGRDLRFQRVSADEYRRGLIDAQLPEDFATFLTELMTMLLDGRNAHVTDGVQQALGRPARDFSDYVKRVARRGVWDAPVHATAGSAAQGPPNLHT